MTAVDGGPVAVYPVGLRLLDRRAVVVGGGRFAHRQVAGLLEAAARVTVVSPDLTPALEALAGHGRAPETPVAIVTDGSTVTQRLVQTTLAGLPATVSGEDSRPPAVWVVGEVVGQTRRPTRNA
jgi:siroheme synthase